MWVAEHSIEIGPGIGPEISGDFPQVLAALAERVESPS
jgi:hypothetical protein